MPPPYDIGILTGSGPDAGIDMWAAMLGAWRAILGEEYRGDLDAPAVVVHSVPALGASMDLARHSGSLRRIVLDHAAELDAVCGRWVIACNTLNHFAPAIVDADPASTFVSFTAVVERLVRQAPAGSVALLGAQPVAELGEWSPYAALAPLLLRLDDEVIGAVHHLIEDVKRHGATPELTVRLDELSGRLPASQVLLACTELPLVAGADHRYVDVTRAVARHVVEHTLADRRLLS
jgi:aspartate racemase